MRRMFSILFALFILLACKQEPVTFYVLETSDLHGEFGPAMSSAASYIRQIQNQHRDNLILLDCGDCFQGSPEIFYYNSIDTTATHIYSQFFNWFPYSALGVGNHDFEAGKDVFERVYADVDMPVLCANIVDEKTQIPLFEPYTIIRKKGYKIAVLGLVTTSALEWIPENQCDGAVLVSASEAAAYWTDYIYKKEDPDVFIGLFHLGMDTEDKESARWIARNVPGIHLICSGHIHKAGVGYVVNNQGDSVCIMGAGARASHVGTALVSVTPKDMGKPTVRVTAEAVPTNTYLTNLEYDQLMAPFLQKAGNYYKTSICVIDTTLYSRDALVGPSGWMAFLHKSFRSIAESMGPYGVDFTIASPSSRNAVLEKGPLSVKDFISIYPYENTLSIVEMTGREIVDYLEYAYSLAIEKPDDPIYNFDSVSGLSYRVHKDNPYGQRIEAIQKSDQAVFYLERRYHVAMTTFRALGGGGHLSKGLHWSMDKMRARCIVGSDKSIRASLIDIYSKDTVDTRPLDQWCYISAE